MKRGLLAAVLFISACRATLPVCSPVYAAWTLPHSHMTLSIRQPFVVPRIQGRVLPPDGDTWEATETRLIRLELQRDGRPAGEVVIGADGRFAMDVPDGVYCFHLTSEYFQGYERTAIVRRSAPSDALIQLRVLMGV